MAVEASERVNRFGMIAQRTRGIEVSVAPITAKWVMFLYMIIDAILSVESGIAVWALEVVNGVLMLLQSMATREHEFTVIAIPCLAMSSMQRKVMIEIITAVVFCAVAVVALRSTHGEGGLGRGEPAAE